MRSIHKSSVLYIVDTLPYSYVHQTDMHAFECEFGIAHHANIGEDAELSHQNPTVPLQSTKLIAQVISILGADRVIFTDNGIAPSSSEKGVVNAADNPGTLESALQDMALMSHCNDLVMTVASSFGYVAAAWGGYAPVRNPFEYFWQVCT